MTIRPLCPSARPLGLLSRGEARVLALSAAGFTREETARILRVGSETVKSQRATAAHKLGARNTAHAVALGFARGYLTPDVLARAAQFAEASR